MPKKKRDNRYHQPRNVSLPLFKPFTTIKLMVWFRSQCSGPVKVRLRGKYGFSFITVFEVIMPEREDLDGIPILRYMEANKYCDLLDAKEQDAKRRILLQELSTLDYTALRERITA